jgi:hypothetical protein
MQSLRLSIPITVLSHSNFGTISKQFHELLKEIDVLLDHNQIPFANRGTAGNEGINTK